MRTRLAILFMLAAFMTAPPSRSAQGPVKGSLAEPAQPALCEALQQLEAAAAKDLRPLLGRKISQTQDGDATFQTSLVLPGFSAASITQRKMQGLLDHDWLEHESTRTYDEEQIPEALADSNQLLVDLARCGYGIGEPNPYQQAHQQIFNWYLDGDRDLGGKPFYKTLALILSVTEQGYRLSLGMSKFHGTRQATAVTQSGKRIPEVAMIPFAHHAAWISKRLSARVHQASIAYMSLLTRLEPVLDEIRSQSAGLAASAPGAELIVRHRKVSSAIAHVRTALAAYQRKYAGGIDELIRLSLSEQAAELIQIELRWRIALDAPDAAGAERP